MHMKSWIPNAIIYQINLRALAAREPRNAFEAAQEAEPTQSPLAYVCSQMDYFIQLGVTVLHLMPPYPMGQANRKGIGSPYAARDYFSIDPEWGTLDDFRQFLQCAHDVGLKVIVGMVPNHSSRDHAWITEHPDFYVTTDEGEAAFDLDWSDTAKLDYTQPGLRQAMIEVYDFWLTIGHPSDSSPGVDGFRIDMAHFINDTSFWNEASAELARRHPDREILLMAECYGTQNNLNLFARGLNAAYDDQFYKLCQYFYGVSADGASRLLPTEDEAFANGDFRPVAKARKQGGIRMAVVEALRGYESIDPSEDGPRVARYTDNHDEGRGAFRFGPDATQAYMALAFLTPNSMPFILTGQEFGAENRPSIHERIQPCDKGRRVSANDSTHQQEGVEFEGNLFARGWDQRQAHYTFYRTLIDLRKAYPALVSGSFKVLDVEEINSDEPSILAFDRVLDSGSLRCLINLSHDSIEFTDPGGTTETLLGQSDPTHLEPFEVRIQTLTAT